MSERLQYYDHSTRFQAHAMHGEALTKANEVHELAADVQHIGAIALFDEVQTSKRIGNPIEITIPNPISGYSQKRTPSSLLGKGKRRYERIVATLVEADEALDDLQAGLDELAVSGENGVKLHDIAPASHGISVFHSI